MEVPEIHGAVVEKVEEGRVAHPQVDPFLVEALQNPRHRLTVLRMELDIQRFMQNPEQHQFEFQHFPTSYLRCAAHRVAQYYGLQTLLLDNGLDGSGNRILAMKTPESRFPSVHLSDIPTKQAETENIGQVKIAIKARPNKASSGDGVDLEAKKSQVRTVEERKEEYDKARARIFSRSSSPEVEGSCMVAAEDGNIYESADEQENCRTWADEGEKASPKDGASRVAIFRDKEKDRNDPDYDRSYDRYARSLSFSPTFGVGAGNVFQSPLMPYEAGFPQVPGVQSSMSFSQANPVMGPFCAFGCNQTSRDAVYMQWPSTAMFYAHSYEHFRHAMFPAPFYQQPLSFDGKPPQ
ncbi:mRNA-binding protein Encore protein [Dioscorea alata]|uniref:mRNA-binding protein Encore protein n=1 Tax=Dioscorea alata TaxID=55571 RepID=A0ACB7U3L7_DIOAL|nr:mRNA-binding protein Encore protein [Dioscorea alata]